MMMMLTVRPLLMRMAMRMLMLMLAMVAMMSFDKDARTCSEARCTTEARNDVRKLESRRRMRGYDVP